MIYAGQCYSCKLGIDGFWSLYVNGIECYSCHDDKIQVPLKASTDEIITVLIQFYEAGVS